jgi:hypothetical protein
MPTRPVTFFYPYPDELAARASYDLSDHEFWSHEGKERRRAWVLQTALRLQQSGHDVSLSPHLPTEGIVVLLPEPDAQAEFRRQYGRAHRSLFVLTIRADVFGFRSPLGDADIVQNGRFADDRRTFFIPHWPQPGLLPRDPTRDARIETIVFKGGYGSLHADYRSDAWHDYLAERNLTFRIASAETEGTVPTWHDYRTADLNLAVRPPFNDGGLRCEKPASKLINAWHAGVPSLLGKEYAFRELRQSDLDYVEVETLSDTMNAIDRLLASRDRYRKMIAHGRTRAQAFTPERITDRWAEVLFDRIPRILSTRSYRASRPLPLRARQVFNLVTRPPAPFELRKHVGHLVRTTRQRFG